MNRPKILLTGFLPFLGEKENPSQRIVEEIAIMKLEGVDTLVLPVSFERSWANLQQTLSHCSYDYILLLGQAGGRRDINFERVALNWIETEHPDEDGVAPKMGSISSEAEVLFTQLPVHQFVQQVKTKNIPASVSLSAGGYVCNYLYYRTLQHLTSQNQPRHCCFIHVPYLPEQAAGKSPEPASMEFLTMVEAIKIVIENLK